MNNQTFNIQQGTVTFWVKKNKVKYNDNKVIVFLDMNNKEGKVSLAKDTNNQLRFLYSVEGRTRTELKHDISSLSPQDDHMFGITWSIDSKEIILYIDGVSVAKTSIGY